MTTGPFDEIAQVSKALLIVRKEIDRLRAECKERDPDLKGALESIRNVCLMDDFVASDKEWIVQRVDGVTPR